MIIVNFKLWFLVHVVLPSLAIVLTVTITVANATMLILYIIKRWIERVKRRI